jgi:hypothetical protein
MRTSFLLVGAALFAALVAVVACGTPDPNYGDPGGIIGKKLPSEPGGTSAPGAEDTSPFKDTTSTAPLKTLKAAHAAANAPAPEAVPECLGCHGKAGAGATSKWTFAGRVVNGGAGVKDVDVIVAKDAVKVGPVKSDADGFFWAPIALGDVPEGSRA